VLAIGSEPTTLDPHLADDGGERAVNDNVYETLVTRDAAGELVPDLAAELPTQVDETTWQVELRTDAVFHDGTPFDADAVVATVERVLALGEESDQASFYATIARATAVDADTVEITTTGPDPVLPARLYLLRIVAPGAADAPDFAEHPVGTGPYRFVEWVRGQSVTLEADPDFRDGPPAIERATFEFVPEGSTRLAGLLAGEYDLITNLAPEDVDRAPRSASTAGLEHPLVILDVEEGITADERVRRALNLAVDREAIAAELYGGFGAVDPGQFIGEESFGFHTGLEAYPYDPEEARRLLEEAGAVGQRIELVGVAGRWLKDRETVEAIGGYWEEVGLQVDVQVLEFSAWLETWSNQSGRPDAIFLNSSNELFDADRALTALLHPDGVGSSNDDVEVGRLLDEARSETDLDARLALYEEAQARAHDGAYFVYLLNTEDSYGLSDRLQFEPRVDAKLLVADMALEAA
jgi:peptide/nickel transport system substrate-binding protein